MLKYLHFHVPQQLLAIYSALYYEAGLSKRVRVDLTFWILDSAEILVGAQAGLGGIWEVSVGSRVSLLTGLVELDDSCMNRQERKQFLSLFSWL